MDRISAFMDGESSHTEAHQVILRLKDHEEDCDAWKTFHLIGDVLRGEPVMRADFEQRFHSRMQQEPTVLAPRRYAWRKTVNYGLSAAASITAVAVVLTLVLSDNPLQPQPQLAALPKPVPVVQTAAAPQPVPAASQRRVNEYLMAHQEYSPSTTLQGVAPYVRTVSAPRDGSPR